jgi:DNA repair ATPase RecN
MITLWLAAGVLAGAQGPVIEPPPPPRRDGGADVQRKTRIKEWFLERQLKEFEETLAEIGEAEDATEAVEAALEAFEPIAARVDDGRALEAVRAISEALRTVADSRQARNAAVAEVETQLAKIAAIQRRKRRDEAAILLLM